MSCHFQPDIQSVEQEDTLKIPIESRVMVCQMEALFGLIIGLYEQLALKSRHTPRSGINHKSFTLRLVHNHNKQ
jgi:hypothetical protein